jgi:CO/xanthine dehydrogenase FAD-binding subunit
MEILDFTYHRPTSLSEACKMGRELGDSARYFAGGTEIIIDFRTQRDAAEHLISLQQVPGLAAIEADEGNLRIGAMASLAEIAESTIVEERYPALGFAAGLMAGEQIRSQATIGGNFCRAVSCADTPPICIAGEARVTILGADGERSLAAEEFFTGPRQTVLQPGEILTSIVIPEQPANSGADYQRFTLRAGQALAVAAVAARLTLEGGKIAGARIALGAVGPTPLFVPDCGDSLLGKSPGEAVFAAAAEIAAAAAKPICDLRGSDEYRRDLVRTLTLRALSTAHARAEGASA